MKSRISIAMKLLALFTILSLFTSACTLEDILAALARLCAMPVFAVTTTADTATGLCSSSGCSLRQAVITSNSCPGNQTISLPAGTYVLTHIGAGEDAARSGDLDLTDSVSILGEGSPIVDGNRTDRIFDVLPGTTVDITGLTIQHGDVLADGGGIRSQGILRLHNITLQENNANPLPGTAVPGGGAILSEGDGTLTMEGSQVIDNYAFQGGGIAIYANGTTSPLVEITDSDISGNSAGITGGGLWLDVGARVSMTNVAIHDNSASSHDGDGVWNASTLTMDHVHIYGNHGGINGGGIYNEPAGQISAQHVLVENNLARFGGGLYNRGVASFVQSAIVNNTAERGQGGGVYNVEAESALTINNTTISGNQGPLGGGAIRNDNGNFQVVFSTLAANSPDGINGSGSGEMTMRDSILAGHSGGNCTGIPTVSNGFNIEDANTCGFIEPVDLVSTDPQIMPLALDGATYVHALNPLSPAIDSADPDRCTSLDQRGVARPQGLRCDRGAYEVETGSTTAPLVYASPTPLATKAGIILIASPNPTAVATATATPTETPTTAPAASLAFSQPSLSVDHFYSGGAGCGPLDLTLQVGVSQPKQVSSVVLFFHLKDKAGSGSTDWNEGVVMEPLGSGVYSYDLMSKTIPAFNSYPEAWLVYQFTATGAGGQVLLRSPAYSNVTLTMCGKK